MSSLEFVFSSPLFGYDGCRVYFLFSVLPPPSLISSFSSSPPTLSPPSLSLSLSLSLSISLPPTTLPLSLCIYHAEQRCFRWWSAANANVAWHCLQSTSCAAIPSTNSKREREHWVAETWWSRRSSYYILGYAAVIPSVTACLLGWSHCTDVSTH